MKKTFAILISLLFLGSIAGITSLSANGLAVKCYFDKSIVHRGEYATYQYYVKKNLNINFNNF